MDYPNAIGFVGDGEPRYRVTLEITDESNQTTVRTMYRTWDPEGLRDAIRAASEQQGVYL